MLSYLKIVIYAHPRLLQVLRTRQQGGSGGFLVPQLQRLTQALNRCRWDDRVTGVKEVHGGILSGLLG